MIEVKDLNFSYKEKQIFKNLNLKFEKNKITTIVGPNGSGKSTLVKILIGLLKGNVYIEEKPIKKIKNLRKMIGVVFEDPENQFIADTVREDLSFTLENMEYSKEQISEKIAWIASYLNITDILDKNPNLLNNNQKQIVAFANAIVHDPKILILDESLTYIDDKESIFKILKKLKQTTTIILITHNPEETLISDNIVLLKKGEIVFNGKRNDYYKLDVELPFIVELSNKLMFYDLIEKVYYDMEELVNALWK